MSRDKQQVGSVDRGSGTQRHTCIVCGRSFPEGQGVVIRTRDRVLTFHSKSCAVKFFRHYMDLVDPQCLDKYVDKIVEEFRALREKTVRKKIFEEE